MSHVHRDVHRDGWQTACELKYEGLYDVIGLHGARKSLDVQHMSSGLEALLTLPISSPLQLILSLRSVQFNPIQFHCVSFEGRRFQRPAQFFEWKGRVPTSPCSDAYVNEIRMFLRTYSLNWRRRNIFRFRTVETDAPTSNTCNRYIKLNSKSDQAGLHIYTCYSSSTLNYLLYEDFFKKS